MVSENKVSQSSGDSSGWFGRIILIDAIVTMDFVKLQSLSRFFKVFTHCQLASPERCKFLCYHLSCFVSATTSSIEDVTSSSFRFISNIFVNIFALGYKCKRRSDKTQNRTSYASFLWSFDSIGSDENNTARIVYWSDALNLNMHCMLEWSHPSNLYVLIFHSFFSFRSLSETNRLMKWLCCSEK